MHCSAALRFAAAPRRKPLTYCALARESSLAIVEHDMKGTKGLCGPRRQPGPTSPEWNVCVVSTRLGQYDAVHSAPERGASHVSVLADDGSAFASLPSAVLHKIAIALSVLGIWMGVSTAAHAATVLKIGTLAPADSPWGKGFKRWAAEVAAGTGGALQLDFQWNGQAGDEVLMVEKIRSGQIDGAAVTAVGLGQTGVTDVLIFQLPGLFTNWNKLDQARNAVKDELEKQFASKGFTVLGWGDVGAAKTMSVGFEVHKPTDLQGKGVFFFAGDSVQPKIYSAIGGITPKQITVAEILPNLTSGAVNVLTVPPLAAEQLQWASRVTHISTQTIAFAIGAFIVSSARLSALPPAQKEVLLAKSREMSDQATLTIRKADAAAFARMKASKIAYDPTDDDRKAWTDVFVNVAKHLRGPVFNPAIFDKIVKIAQPPVPLL